MLLFELWGARFEDRGMRQGLSELFLIIKTRILMKILIKKNLAAGKVTDLFRAR
jgi:hypothetical protein